MRIDYFSGRNIRFLDEQDGPPEQELKRQLSNYLSCEHEIRRAYLVRIAYDASSTPNLALCLVGERTNALQLIQSTETIFKELFQTTESMDILFLNEIQKREVSLIAQPFYSSDGTDHCRPN